jgi:hypothetical protein
LVDLLSVILAVRCPLLVQRRHNDDGMMGIPIISRFPTSTGGRSNS